MSKIYTFSVDVDFGDKLDKDVELIMRRISKMVTDTCEEECIKAVNESLWSKC